MIPIGFTLQPERRFLDGCAPLLDAVDYFEVAPETLWRTDESGALLPNGFHRRFAKLKQHTGKQFVAHGVGYSLGSTASDDRARRRAFRERIAADAHTFEFAWWTDHLGATSLDGLAFTLPMPLPLDARTATIVRRRLGEMQTVVADVGLENSVVHFTLGDPLDEPQFLERALAAPGTHLLLDLHNVYTMAQNFHFDPAEYLRQLDLSRVIEIHVSGGSDSDAAWLPSGRVMRLDGHDGAVPEAVWQLCETWAPRCPRLRGLTLERMEGTVADEDDVARLADELRRLRGIAER